AKRKNRDKRQDSLLESSDFFQVQFGGEGGDRRPSIFLLLPSWPALVRDNHHPGAGFGDDVKRMHVVIRQRKCFVSRKATNLFPLLEECLLLQRHRLQLILVSP